MIYEQIRVHVRMIIRRDLDDVLAIERKTYGKLAWGEEEFLACLRRRNCIGFVADHGDQTVGFIIYTMFHGYVEMDNIAVAPRYRRKSVGLQLIRRMTSKLYERRNRATAAIPENCLAALCMLRSCGWKSTSMERFETNDIIHMEYKL